MVNPRNTFSGEVIRRPIRRGKLLDGMSGKGGGIPSVLVADNFLGLRQRFQPSVDPLFSGFPPGFQHSK
jgi:hypothetical protein